MTSPIRARLILDEMFSPALVVPLRDIGHDVIAVTERSDLRAMTDGELCTWAINERRWLLTENVKDFRPILLRAAQGGTAVTGILFTSSRASRARARTRARSSMPSAAGSWPVRLILRSQRTG